MDSKNRPSNPSAAAIDQLSEQVETVILQHDRRGMTRLRPHLKAGYCVRAARLLLRQKGVVAIGTGFPVSATFESDGPIGAIALYQVLAHLGYVPVMVCAAPISKVLARRYRTRELPIAEWESSREAIRRALAELNPLLAVSVERAGRTADGRYYNMRREDITDAVAKYDLFLEECACPSIAFGDGGNEIGMGNVHAALAQTDIIASVTTCDELVIASVSNWGVYGVIGMMAVLEKKDLFKQFDIGRIADFLFANGCVDGITRYVAPGEDGFPISTGLQVVEEIRALIAPILQPGPRARRFP
jgi:hypothetical protein